jgi:hypothetical protein
MLRVIEALLVLSILCCSAHAKVVVFWQDGFPAVDSQPVSQLALQEALGMPHFVGVDDLKRAETFKDADLLVLPYGSAFPADAWESIRAFLEQGGNILTLGGRPFFVPVFRQEGRFVQSVAQNTYSRFLGFQHSYEVPQKDKVEFMWDDGYEFLGPAEVRARRVFVVAAGWEVPSDRRGLGYLVNAEYEKISAPVVRQDFIEAGAPKQAMLGSRCVYLNFEPEPGYWDSSSGIGLIQRMADYARRGATVLSLEMQDTSLAEGETPRVTIQMRNVRRQRAGLPQEGFLRVELVSNESVFASKQIDCSSYAVQASVEFPKALVPGFYLIRATYQEGGKPREFYQTGFWVRDESTLRKGSILGVNNTYFTKDGAPFLPFGTNYFTTDPLEQGLVGPGNACFWEHDFAEMEKHGVTFIRTGIWNDHIAFLDKLTGAASEQFLRNLEAFLLSAGRHHVQVHFTFFAFDPQTIKRHPGEESLLRGPGGNPYTDPVAIRAQQNYILSVVNRFKDVPFLSWDLINEPSFSNPKRLWKGNTPNNDPTEISEWNKWLASHYETAGKLAQAWRSTPEEFGSFGSISLPDVNDLELTRYGNSKELRAFDYNLFAQDMFDRWVSEMVRAIRSTGSRQLVTVGQDEGGVTDRLLAQFYGGAGVNFTVNHTYWRDDALLWDSFAAKRPDMPNLIGETGYQPVWRADGAWRWDEVTAFGLLERKLALGFAAANSGSLQWAWERGDIFGVKRGDGSNKIWEGMFHEMGDFAKKAAPYATGMQQPEVAVVLPQSLQLSVFNPLALEAQQKCVRALYHYARSSAYAVGEYQIDLLGNPKLIILPSPWVLSQHAWEAILSRVREGATLLVSGRFDADPHFHSVHREADSGLDYQPGILATRENLVVWPGGRAWLSYSNEKTTYLERAVFPSGETFLEKQVGKGSIVFFAFPLELNDSLKAIGDVYRYALKKAQVAPAYSTEVEDPGILICPTEWRNATLYVLTSESSSIAPVRFRDAASGKDFATHLDAGRAALIVVAHRGEILASYNWHALQ